MDKNITESMDVTSFSKEDLEKQVSQFLSEGWQLYTGIDESVYSNDSGLSIITYSRTLVKY